MPGKNTLARRIDKERTSGGGGEVVASTPSYAPPAPKSIPEPEDLILDSFLARSSATPTALITAVWSRPVGTAPQEYVIQVAQSNTFPDGATTTTNARSESATLEGLKPNTLYYVRVAAVFRAIQSDWSEVVSETTPNDTVPAAQPTGLAGIWIGTGDLRITFTPPTDENYKDCEIKIYGSSGGTHYHTEYNRGGSYVYPVALNIERNGGTGDPSLYVEVRSRTYFNTINNVSPLTLSTTKSAPTAPGVAHSWSGETDHAGVAAADLTFVFTLDTDVAKVRLALNAQTARDVLGTVYTYPHSRNVADNGAPGDPTLSYSAIAVDGLGQVSTATTGNATNEDPPTPTATLVGGAISLLVATAGGTLASDFERYEFVFKRDTVAVATREQAEAVAHYELSTTGDSGLHDWAVTIRQKDRFGQFSNSVTSSTVSVDALTIAAIRADCTYTDSDGNSVSTLNALKDANTSSGGVTYNP